MVLHKKMDFWKSFFKEKRVTQISFNSVLDFNRLTVSDSSGQLFFIALTQNIMPGNDWLPFLFPDDDIVIFLVILLIIIDQTERQKDKI